MCVLAMLLILALNSRFEKEKEACLVCYFTTENCSALKMFRKKPNRDVHWFVVVIVVALSRDVGFPSTLMVFTRGRCFRSNLSEQFWSCYAMLFKTNVNKATNDELTNLTNRGTGWEVTFTLLYNIRDVLITPRRSRSMEKNGVCTLRKKGGDKRLITWLGFHYFIQILLNCSIGKHALSEVVRFLFKTLRDYFHELCQSSRDGTCRTSFKMTRIFDLCPSDFLMSEIFVSILYLAHSSVSEKPHSSWARLHSQLRESASAKCLFIHICQRKDLTT